MTRSNCLKPHCVRVEDTDTAVTKDSPMFHSFISIFHQNLCSLFLEISAADLKLQHSVQNVSVHGWLLLHPIYFTFVFTIIKYFLQRLPICHSRKMFHT